MGPAVVDISPLLAWDASGTPQPAAHEEAQCRACAAALDAALQSDGLLRLRFSSPPEAAAQQRQQRQGGGGGGGGADGGEEKEKEKAASSAASVPGSGGLLRSGEMLDAARALFALSAEEKRQAAADVARRPGFVRGYLGMGAESGLKGMHEPKVSAPRATGGLRQHRPGARLWDPPSLLACLAGTAAPRPAAPSADSLASPPPPHSPALPSPCTHAILQEGFSYGFAWPDSLPPANGLQGPNVWPPALSQEGAGRPQAFARQRLDGAYVSLVAVARAVVRGIALALGTPAEQLLAQCDGGETISLVRLFHYFPAVAGKDNCIGSSPHTDWGFLTLIAQDSVGGLEYKRGDTWHSVPPTPDGTSELILNGGDALELMSAGRYRAPVHRVLCPPPGQERHSLVFFYYPNYNATLDAPEWRGGRGSEQAEETVAGAYNTLLQGVERSEAGDLPPFGDCILQKWRGVSRAGY